MRKLRVYLALGLAVLLWSFATTVGAQELPPRPPPPAPTAIAEPEEEDRPSTMAPGRITGTVIDQRTGAPAAGVRVRVGDELLLSDGNGNYDRHGLEPGAYGVALVLDAEQGVALQGPITVELAAGATVVQHLAFASPAPVAVEPVPVVEVPAAPVPATLPATGTAHDAGWLGVVALLLLVGGWVVRR